MPTRNTRPGKHAPKDGRHSPTSREPIHFQPLSRAVRRWALNGVFERVFESLSGDPDFEYAIIDGTIVRVHQHGTGARGGTQAQAIGRSRGGLTTKILALVDALGNLARFLLLPGQRHDSVGVDPLICNLDFGALLADKAFDGDELRMELDRRGVTAVIPPKVNRKQPIACDFAMYKWRHLVENFFAPAERVAFSPELKQFRRIATRYDKTDTSFQAMICLASAVISSR